MKRLLKILGISVAILAIILVAVAYIGSTKHSELKGGDGEKLQTFMENFAEEEGFNGSVLAVKDGEVVLNESYGLADKENKIPFSNDIIFPIGSITKPMTAALIMQLEEEGKLSVNDRLSTYFPELKHGEQISIHQLLNHTSGLADIYDDEEIAGNWTEFHTEEQVLNSFANKDLLSEPGEKYKYISSDYYLLGKIIEQVTGETYSSYLQKNIFDKAGMHNTFFMTEENIGSLKVKGYEDGKLIENLHPSLLFSAGAVASTKEDLVKFVEALDANLIMSKKQKDNMTTPTAKVSMLGVGYGYGWYVTDNFYSFNEKEIDHGGSLPGLRTGLLHFPERSLTIVIVTNNGEAWNYAKLGKEIASIIFNKRYWFYHELP